MASRSSKDDDVVFKPQEFSTFHIPKEVIKRTIKKLKQFFGEEVKVYVILGVGTGTDYVGSVADLRVLDSYQDPYVYPPLPALDYLISDAKLPMGYVLYVVMKGVKKAYIFQVQISISPGEYVKVSPYLESTSESGGPIPCKDPINPEVPGEFLWNQEGPNQVHRIYKERTDGDKTKLYWQYTGDGGIVTFVDNHALGLSVRLNFKVPSHDRMGSYGNRNNRVESTSKLDVINTYIDGGRIKDTIAELKQYFGQDVEVYVVLGDHRVTDLDVQVADMRVLGYPNPFLFPTLALDHLTSETTLPGGYILYVVHEKKTARKAYMYENRKLNKICGPCLEPTNKDQESIPCQQVPFDPKSPKVPPEKFLWSQEGPDIDYKIYKEQTDGTKLYWYYPGLDKIVTFSKDFGHSVELYFKEICPKMN